MRKIWILILCMLFMTACTPINEDDYTTGLIFSFNEELNTYAVVGYEGIETTLKIPNTYQGYRVTELQFSSESIPEAIRFEEIILPNNIIKLGNSTFSLSQFENINQIVIPINCRVFAMAFYYNTNIDVIIPSNHNYLKEITINEVQIVVTKDDKEIVYIPKTTNENKILSISSGVERIANAAAAYTNYKQIILPEGLKTIGDRAFINTWVFREDQEATVIHIPDSVEYIGERAFQGGINQNDLVLPECLLSVGVMAFSFNHINSITIHSNMTQFDSLFYDFPYSEGDRNNLITSIRFTGLNLSEESIDNFIVHFVSTNFYGDRYNGIIVTIELPINDIAQQIREAIELSITVALFKNPEIQYPTFQFE